GMTFHAELVRALTADNRVEVARLFKYPLKVNVVGLEKPVFVKNADAMVGVYRQFFSPGNRCAIELSRVPVAGADLPRHKLLMAHGVVSIDNGRLIAERTADGFKIMRMTVALEATARHPTPRVVTFVGTPNQARYMGRLAYDDVDAYIVSVQQGQRLHVSIDRFAGSALSLQVTENPAGKIL